MKNKHGRIVSRRKHTMGKNSIKHLRKLGYIAKKGKFTLYHNGHKRGRHSRKRGGSPYGQSVVGSEISGITGPSSGNALQFVAANSA
jgi:hypothetical protein